MEHLIAAEQIVCHCRRDAQCSQGLEEIAQNKQFMVSVSVCWECELYPLQRSLPSFLSPSNWSLLFPCTSGPREVGRHRGEVSLGASCGLFWSRLQLLAMPTLSYHESWDVSRGPLGTIRCVRHGISKLARPDVLAPKQQNGRKDFRK